MNNQNSGRDSRDDRERIEQDEKLNRLNNFRKSKQFNKNHKAKDRDFGVPKKVDNYKRQNINSYIQRIDLNNPDELDELDLDDYGN